MRRLKNNRTIKKNNNKMVTSRPLYHLHASSSSVLRFAFSSTRSEISESSSPIPFPLRDRLDMDVTVAPLKRCKILHLVRHAQGVHNVAGEKDHGALMSPTLFDAQLSPLGWQQVSNLREHVLESGLLKRIELLVTSPLLRTMQTAVGVFGGKSQTEGLDLPPLMEANVGGCGLPAISSSDCPPFIAVELCRERLGLHPCDKRRSISESRPLFPAIDFSLIERDEDDLWQADVRESFEDIIARGMKFLSWLMTRKETEIAVVSHSVFLHQMLNALGNDSHEICKKFDNGELRSLVIFDER